MSSLPPDFFVDLTAYTRTTHVTKYDAVDPAVSANLSQKGKVVIITGANRGLGRKAFVPAFARANAKAIVLVARQLSRLDNVEEEIKAINADVQVLKVEADITDSAAVAKIFSDIKGELGAADILINNAGVFASSAPLAEAEAEKWWKDWEVNVKGTFLMTSAFVTQLSASHTGTVINLATSGSLGVYPSMSSYTTSKLAAAHLQRFVAAEAPHVAAMTLDPCLADTDMLLPDFASMRLIDFALIGGAALWLATEEARFMSGRLFNVTWDVSELVARKDEVVDGDELVYGLRGKLGKEQFQ